MRERVTHFDSEGILSSFILHYITTISGRNPVDISADLLTTKIFKKY
jgi:hypothetical protein